jgi:hypothetical protein
VHLGHRRSRDLDLFSFAALSFEPYRALTGSADVSILAESDVALSLRVGDVPVDIVRYPYPLVDPPIAGPGGVPTAGLRDLAARRTTANADRGSRDRAPLRVERDRTGSGFERRGAGQPCADDAALAAGPQLFEDRFRCRGHERVDEATRRAALPNVCVSTRGSRPTDPSLRAIVRPRPG